MNICVCVFKRDVFVAKVILVWCLFRVCFGVWMLFEGVSILFMCLNECSVIGVCVVNKRQCLVGVWKVLDGVLNVLVFLSVLRVWCNCSVCGNDDMVFVCMFVAKVKRVWCLDAVWKVFKSIWVF